MIELSPAERRALRARAHALHPVVSVSQNGLTEGVLAEIDRSLKAHELIKIRVYGEDRQQRGMLLDVICNELNAAPVQHIGNVLVVFREKPAQVPAAPPPKPERKPAPRKLVGGPRKPLRSAPAKSAPAKAAPAPRRRAAVARKSAPRR